MTMNFRLRQARKKKGLKQIDLGTQLGLATIGKPFTSQYIANLENKSSYSFEVAMKIAEILDTTPEWLINGEEPAVNIGRETMIRTLTVEKRKGVPYYNLQQMALIETNFSDIQDDPEFYVDAKPMNDCTAYIPVYGDSMAPRYTNGMIVGIKEETNFKMISSGEAYYIITDKTANSLKIMRYVYQDDDNESVFVLRTKNTEYPGKMVVEKSAILSMHLLKGVIRIDHA